MLLSKARTWSACLLIALACAFGCRAEKTDPTGGETHFLMRCDSNADSCGAPLQCVCGVCTLPCAERATCQALPTAQCVPSSAVQGCAETTGSGICDVGCVVNADCAALSSSHRCEQGVCRAGSLSSGGAGGAPAMQADAGANACVRGTVTANQVLVIGDSFFASSHQITAYLEAMARDAGAISAGERYRDRSDLVANGLALGGNGIAAQYAGGASEAPVKVVVMNGGGADTLLGSCDVVDSHCPVLANAATAAEKLLAKMASDQVQHVIYVFYPDPGDAKVRANLDALRPLIQSVCESAPVPCHWLDLRSVFAGHYPAYVQSDQLNPTDAGSQASAKAIWDTMQASCIAQ
jgi:hypothetical protein